MSAMQIELKPCPFCGKAAQIAPDEIGSGGQHVPPYHAGFFRGAGCGIAFTADDPDEAIEEWNRRSLTSATPPDVADQIDDLIEQLLDAQQDINLAANERMDQSLCDASALIDKTETIIRQAATALRLSAGGCKTERRKFYHHGYSTAELLKARKSPPEFFTDDGEAWRYEYTHSDGEGGAYDMLYRPASPTVEAGHAAS